MIAEICSICQSVTHRNSVFNNNTVRQDEDKNEKKTDRMMQCLTDIALDFNRGNRNNDYSNITPIDVSAIITDILQDNKSIKEEFNTEHFF